MSSYCPTSRSSCSSSVQPRQVGYTTSSSCCCGSHRGQEVTSWRRVNGECHVNPVQQCQHNFRSGQTSCVTSASRTTSTYCSSGGSSYPARPAASGYSQCGGSSYASGGSSYQDGGSSYQHGGSSYGSGGSSYGSVGSTWQGRKAYSGYTGQLTKPSTTSTVRPRSG